MKVNILEEESEIVLRFIETHFNKKSGDQESQNFNLLNKNVNPRIKSALESIEYRKKGNALFKSDKHSDKIHEDIWVLYTKSIALAPNESEELAQGYGNRSALLFHLNKYAESAVTCDTALIITKSEHLKLKLMYRKAQCLFFINVKDVRDTVIEAENFLRHSSLSKAIKNEYALKFKNIWSNSTNIGVGQPLDNSKLKRHYIEEILNFTRHEEIPCASQSIDIKYDKKWGRLVVATQDIPPGKIIAVEQSFLVLTNLQGKYISCSYCNQFSWVSFPCESCIDDIYCSKDCQRNAWLEYHRFECSLYNYYLLQDNPEDETDYDAIFLRIYLKILNKAGSFKKIINDIVNIENCKDPCSKSFNEDKVLDVHNVKSFYSLMSRPIKNLDSKIFYSDLCKIFNLIFLLARETTFFGEDKYSSIDQMTSDPQIIFALILFVRTLLLLPYNMNLLVDRFQGKVSVYGIYISMFLSLFNHSCDPNVESFVAKDNKVIIYSKQPIKQGSQLFVRYLDSEQISPFSGSLLRQSYLKVYYDFVCNCLPCKKDWKNQKAILTTENSFLNRKHKNFVTSLRSIESGGHASYSPVIMEEIVYHLEWMAENFSVNVEEYDIFSKCLKQILQDLFGSYKAEFPKNCEGTTDFF